MAYDILGKNDELLRVTVTEAETPVINIQPAFVDITSAVTSVNNKVGAVTLSTDDIVEGVTNKYLNETTFDGYFDAKTTDNLLQGSTNLYYNNTLVDTHLADGTITDIKTAQLTLTGGTGTQGQVTWNSDEETLDVIQNGATLQLGQETQVHVRNATAGTISDGTPVMVAGTIGASGRITVVPMDGTDPNNAKFFLGITTESIGPGEDGKVTAFGKVRGIDTSTHLEGSVLWVSPTTPGELTSTEPNDNEINMPVAFVVTSHTNGTLFVRALTGIDEHRFAHKVHTHVISDITDFTDNSTNWNTAYSWGDHSTQGYLTNETDPVFSASPAGGITAPDITNWDTAYSWGDHALAGYLTNYVETDPIFTASPAGNITNPDIANWDLAYSWGNHAAAGYLSSVALNDATDVVISTPTTNQVLQYNGTVWVNAESPAGATDLDGLTDVTITTPTTDQVLQYNGTAWVNSASSFATTTYVDTQDALVESNANTYTNAREVAITTAYQTADTNTLASANSYTDTGLATKQALDNGLTSIATLGTAADKMLYTTGVDTYAEADLTAFSRSILAQPTKQDWRDALDILTLTSIVPIANGSTVSETSVQITSDGTTVTLSLEKLGGGDVQVFFSGTDYTIDTTPAATVALTTGTDTNPVLNYVYIPEATKVLTVGTDWPSGVAYAPIATVVVPSAAYVQTDSVYKFHAWTDHLVGSEGIGHLGHINYWIRNQPATWHKGIALTPTIVPSADPDDIFISTTSGEVLQLHEIDFPAFDTQTGSHFHIINHPTTPYLEGSNLNVCTVDSQGNSIANNKWATIVVWGVISSDPGSCQLMVNLPSAFHSSETDALADGERYTDYTIPQEYLGTGFLISRLTFKYTTSASGTWTLVENRDLRGQIPSTLAGGGSGAGVSSLGALTDVDLTTPTNGEALVYDGTTWVNSTVSTVGTLDDLTDVVIGTPATAQYLRYDGTNWVNAVGNVSDFVNDAGYLDAVTPLDDLSDVVITTPITNQVLKYDGTNWINDTSPAGATDLDGLTDVTITTPTTDQVLKYNGTTWVNAAAPGGAGTFEGLTDVDIGSPKLDGAALRWNDTLGTWETKLAPISDFINDTGYLDATTVINDLSDVVITTPTTNQVLQYNGTNWVNATGGGGASALNDLSDVAIGGTPLTDGDLLRYNGIAAEWQNTNLGITVAPTLTPHMTTIYAGNMVVFEAAGTYDQPSYEIILVKPDLTEQTFEVIYTRPVTNPYQMLTGMDGKAMVTSSGMINFLIPSVTGSYTLKVRVQDFGDLPSEVASYNFTAVSRENFNPSDVAGRYIRLTTTREPTSGLTTEPFMDDVPLRTGQYAQLANISYYTAAAGGGTEHPNADMTSDSAPSPYVVTVSSVFLNSASYYGYKAFDSSFSTSWWGYTSAGGDWITLDMGSSQTIKSMGIYNSNLSYFPYGFKIEVSDTGAFAGEETEIYSIDGFVQSTLVNANTILG